MRAWTTAAVLGALVVVAVGQHGSAPAEAARAATCKLRAETPKRVLEKSSGGEEVPYIQTVASVRCSRTVRRDVAVDAMLELESGKVVPNGGSGINNATIRPGKWRSAGGVSKTCWGYVRNPKARTDPAVKAFSRITLSKVRGRRLQREHSKRVSLTDLCPEGTERSPRAEGPPR
jgi:hypothetical protein